MNWKKYKPIILHVLFWMTFEIVPSVRYLDLKFEYLASNDQKVFLINILINLLNFYAFYVLVLPIFHKSKNRLTPIAWTIFFFVLWFYMRYYLIQIMCNCTYEDLKYKKYSSEWFRGFHTILYMMFAAFISLGEKWFQDQRLKSQLIMQKKESELAFLRMQINPHFLFNTLNNIYSLTYKQSRKAPQAVIKLSEIMRYMLSESSEKEVHLETELKYISSFIALQRLRLKKENLIDYSVEGKVDDQKIAPMLLIPFIENAFSHGDKSDESKPVKINIKIDNNLTLIVENSYSKSRTEDIHKSHGLGLKNVRRRLELLYEDRYNLEVSNDLNNNLYRVSLTLSL